MTQHLDQHGGIGEMKPATPSPPWRLPMLKRFKLLKGQPHLDQKLRAGTTVYECVRHDYGCRQDSERFTGEPHTVVTLDRDGEYPFFVVPTADLRRLSELTEGKENG